MVTSPNQRVVVCSIEQVTKGAGKPYFIVYRDSLNEAMQKINTVSGLKVWLYLQSNQNDFELGFSSKDVSDKTGISEDAARDGFNKLVELGYLVQGNQKNKYVFNTKQKVKVKELPIETKPFKDSQGEIRQLTFKQLEDMVGTELAKQYWED